MLVIMPTVPVRLMTWVSTVLEPARVALTVRVAVLAPTEVPVNWTVMVQLGLPVAGFTVPSGTDAGQVFAEMANSPTLAPPSTAVIGLKFTPPLFLTVKVRALGVFRTALPYSPTFGVTDSGPVAVPASAAGTAVTPPVPVAVRVPALAGGVRSSGANRTSWVQVRVDVFATRSEKPVQPAPVRPPESTNWPVVAITTLVTGVR